MHAGDGKACQGREIVAHRAKIGRKHEFDRQPGESRIGLHESAARGVIQIADQDRFVDLHPLRARLRQRLDRLDIERQDFRQQRPAVRTIDHPGELEERHRPDQDRARGDAQEFRFVIFVQHFGAAERKLRVRRQFRHDVMIIGVEPFGHFHRAGVLAPARHGEIEIRVNRSAPVAEAVRHRAQQDDGVQHLVVQRKIVRGDVIDPRALLREPVAGAQGGGDLVQPLRPDIVRPETLQRLFEFAVAADAGKAQIGRKNPV